MKTIQKLHWIFCPLFLLSCTIADNNYDYNANWDYQANPSEEKYKDYAENPFIKVSDQAISTFSVDADGGSYANMRRFMASGDTVPRAAVRIEEFLNYFTFDYADPVGSENVALNSEVAICPWNSNHYLLRLGMKGKSIPENELPNSNFVFLIDVSGSMSYDDKLETLKAGFKLMTDQLRDNDKVAIVTYAGSAGVLLQSTKGSEKKAIKAAIDKLGAGGSTAGAQGIITAYEIAQKNFVEGGNNRIIIGSDGDFNVGPSSTEELTKLIEKKRETGIYITTLGVGTGNLNDNMMEQIANKGNGNYEYIDCADELVKIFINEKSKFYTVAKDSKIQITFNPDRVAQYRLIGYENRALKNEDFENDSTDAGEIGAGQTITALYEIIPTLNLSATSFAQFDFRYKKPNETDSRLLQHSVTTTAKPMTAASDNMRFASALAGFGLILKHSQYKGTASKQMVLDLGKTALTYDPNQYRSRFIEIINNWQPR